MKSRTKPIHCLVVCLTLLGGAAAQAATCMVVGEKAARVASMEGERSPVFLTADCAALRLKSGKAMVTWVSRDGKPNFAAIGEGGPERLPTAGSEERSGKVVWAELTTKRESSRPAFMRALDEERPARIYIPAAGLELPSNSGTALKVQRMEGDQLRTVLESSDSSALRLGRDALQAGGTYVLEWTQDGKVDRWRWRVLDADVTGQLDRAQAEIESANLDPEQRRVVTAMLYEQLKLNVNMGFQLALPAAR